MRARPAVGRRQRSWWEEIRRATLLAAKELAIADFAKHKIFGWREHGEMTRYRWCGKLERTIEHRLRLAVALVGFAVRGVRVVLKCTDEPATGRLDPSSVTLPRMTTPFGRTKLIDCSIAPLGQSIRF